MELRRPGRSPFMNYTRNIVWRLSLRAFSLVASELAADGDVCAELFAMSQRTMRSHRPNATRRDCVSSRRISIIVQERASRVRQLRAGSSRLSGRRGSRRGCENRNSTRRTTGGSGMDVRLDGQNEGWRQPSQFPADQRLSTGRLLVGHSARENLRKQ